MLCFAGFELDTERARLRGPGGEAIRLRPKSFDMLQLFVTNSGRVLSKQDLIDAIWPNVHVGDDSLFQCIREIRTALGDDQRQLIKLVSGRGYLFEADVSAGPGGLSAGPGAGAETIPSRRRGRRQIGRRGPAACHGRACPEAVPFRAARRGAPCRCGRTGRGPSALPPQRRSSRPISFSRESLRPSPRSRSLARVTARKLPSWRRAWLTASARPSALPPRRRSSHPIFLGAQAADRLRDADRRRRRQPAGYRDGGGRDRPSHRRPGEDRQVARAGAAIGNGVGFAPDRRRAPGSGLRGEWRVADGGRHLDHAGAHEQWRHRRSAVGGLHLGGHRKFRRVAAADPARRGCGPSAGASHQCDDQCRSGRDRP